jgi:hypothetical protein
LYLPSVEKPMDDRIDNSDSKKDFLPCTSERQIDAIAPRFAFRGRLAVVIM